MLEKLNSKQEQILIDVKNEWINRLFSCPEVNNVKATEGINWLYEFCKLDKPKDIIFIESPMQAQFIINLIVNVSDHILKKLNVKSNNIMAVQVRGQVWDQWWDQVRSQVSDKVSDKVRSQVSEKVSDKVSDKVMGQVSGQVKSQVRGQVMGDFKSKYYSFSAYGNIWDYGWMSFYDCFFRMGIVKHDSFIKFKNLLHSNIYDMIMAKYFCIVCSMPSKIDINDNGDMHNEDTCAIEWKDGYKLWYWNGVNVPEKYIKKEITREDILKEKNAERRRCIQEIIGSKTYAELLDIEQIDADVDQYGNNMILYKTKEKDDLTSDYIYFVNVICPSTQRKYFLCVPEMDNVWDAVAFTFGKTKETYKPIIET
jgi:hypothetical protein